MSICGIWGAIFGFGGPGLGEREYEREFNMGGLHPFLRRSDRGILLWALSWTGLRPVFGLGPAHFCVSVKAGMSVRHCMDIVRFGQKATCAK